MKRKLRIIVDCGDTFCGKCEELYVFPRGRAANCMLFGESLTVAGNTKPKRHPKCLEAEAG